MKTRLFFLIIFLFSSSAFFGQVAHQTSQIIIKQRKVTNQKSTSHGSALNAKVEGICLKYHASKNTRKKLGKSGFNVIDVITFPEGTDIKQVIKEINQTNTVEYVEELFTGSITGVTEEAPFDEHYGDQWALHNDGTFSLSTAKKGADIDMQNAWDIEQGDSTIVVGVIDTGMKLDHPEFDGRIWKNKGEIPNNGIDDDGNNYIDDVRGWDFFNNDNDASDDNGHGTSVAGIIGANAYNAIGFAGVDWNCKLVSLKVLDNNGNSDYLTWAEAIYYAADNGIKVLNMSLGGRGYSFTLQEAITYAVNQNVVVVVTMANSNNDAIYYPAGCNGVIAVGSTDPNDTRSNPFFWSTTAGSCYGEHISVVAPGNYIYVLDYLSDASFSNYGGGTSFATPHVVGITSLLLAQDPTRTPTQIKSIIEQTAIDQVGKPEEDTPGFDIYHGHGRVNAYNALSATTSLPSETLVKKQICTVYPNPNNGSFTVTFPSNATQLLVLNSMGNSIFTSNIAGEAYKKIQLQVGGVYFVQITTSNETYVEKVIVSE